MIFLASKSPRRKQLLSKITGDFETLDINVEEVPQPGEAPEDYVLRVAMDKANMAKRRTHEGDIVIAADTEVALNGTIMGKPANENDAIDMLGRLSGKSHEVISAVIILSDKLAYRINKSMVYFRQTTEQERQWYCKTYSPLDKAGAYGIQDGAAAFIDRFEGSYSGVMGLPLNETRQLLQQSGLMLK